MAPYEDFDTDDDTMDLFDDSDDDSDDVEPWDGVSEPQDEQFQTYSEYESAMREFRTSKAVQRGIEAAVKPAQDAGGLTPWADDPNGADRQANEDFLAQAEKEKADAEARGDAEAARDWSERARMTRNELKELGPSPKEEFEARTEANFETATIDSQLFAKEDSHWENKRLQHDSAICVARANSRAETTLRLPLENGEFGDPLPCRPRNMCKVQLSPEQMEDFRLSVYQSGDSNSPDAVFRRSWDWIRAAGLDTTATKNAQAGDSVAPAPTDRTSAVQRAISSGQKLYDDFSDTVLNPDLELSDGTLDAAMQLGDDAAAVLYYLGKHPGETAHISGMGADEARQAVQAIAQEIFDRNPRSRIKDVSDAPEPISPTGGHAIITKDPEKMSQAEYERWRQGAGR